MDENPYIYALMYSGKVKGYYRMLYDAENAAKNVQKRRDYIPGEMGIVKCKIQAMGLIKPKCELGLGLINAK